MSTEVELNAYRRGEQAYRDFDAALKYGAASVPKNPYGPGGVPALRDAWDNGFSDEREKVAMKREPWIVKRLGIDD